MRERNHKTRGLSQRPFDLDMMVPGFATASGRNTDRFRCSAETRDRKILRERRAMVADLGRRLMHDVLAARMQGQFTTVELELAYKQGTDALRAMAEENRSLRLDALANRWMAVSRIRTKDMALRHVESFIDFCGGREEATTAHLTTERIQQWLSALTDQRRATSGSKQYSESAEAVSARRRRQTKSAARPRRVVTSATRNRHRASLSSFCSFLVHTTGVLSKHPIQRKVAAEREAAARLPNASGAQWSRYLTHMSSDLLAPPASSLAACVLRYTGADIGEVLGLTRKTGERVGGLRVRDMVNDPVLPRLQFKRQKVDVSPSREVPYARTLFDSLLNHVRDFGLTSNEEVFTMIVRSQFEQAHKRARTAAGLPGLRIKDLRHLAAIAWVKGGVPLTRVQRWLGHASIQQTAIYADFASDHDYEAPLIEKALLLAQG